MRLKHVIILALVALLLLTYMRAKVTAISENVHLALDIVRTQDHAAAVLLLDTLDEANIEQAFEGGCVLNPTCLSLEDMLPAFSKRIRELDKYEMDKN